MKMFFAIFLMGLGMASTSHAESALNCLQWNLKTDQGFVSERETQKTVNSILRGGKEFGFAIDDASPNTPYDVHFTYDRETVVDDSSLTRNYEEFIANLKWHLGSMRGYSFECSFEAGGPRPRISGSN